MDITDERTFPRCFGEIDKGYNFHCSQECESTKECVKKCLIKRYGGNYEKNT